MLVDVMAFLRNPASLPADVYEVLVRLYVDLYKLTDRANSEAFAGDDAAADGEMLKAEQHYRYADDYRKQVSELQSVINTKLQNAKAQSLEPQIQTDARQRYGQVVSSP